MTHPNPETAPAAGAAAPTSAPSTPAPAAQPAPAPPTPPAPPVPAPVPSQPAPPAPVPVPQFIAPVPGQQPSPPATAPAMVSEPDGYPVNTPLAQMTAEQQAAYWKHQARKHEDRVKAMSDYDQYKTAYDEYQRLLTASQTEQERAVADARRQGRDQALAEAGGQLVEQWVRAAAAGRLPEESVNALLQGLDRSRFLTNGAVNTDMVYSLINTIAPPTPPAPPPVAAGAGVPGQQPVPPATQPIVAPTRAPDFGQGQPGTSRPSGLAAGREIARARFAQTAAPAK